MGPPSSQVVHPFYFIRLSGYMYAATHQHILGSEVMREARVLSDDEFFAHLPTSCWKDATSLSRFYEPSLLSLYPSLVIISGTMWTARRGL